MSWIRRRERPEPRREDGAPIDPVLSRAVVVFVGKGFSFYPQASWARVVAEMPDADLPALERAVARIDRDFASVTIDWKTLGWHGGCRFAEQQMRVMHPELSEEAIDALGWHLSDVTR